MTPTYQYYITYYQFLIFLCRLQRTGSMSPWCQTAFSCGSSPLLSQWARQASYYKLRPCMMTGSLQIRGFQKLASRLPDPWQGSIRNNNKNFEDTPLAELRDQPMYQPQKNITKISIQKTTLKVLLHSLTHTTTNTQKNLSEKNVKYNTIEKN